MTADPTFDAAVAELKRMAQAKRGRTPVRKIIAYLAGDDHAAFVRQNVVAAFAVRRFPEAYVVGVYKDDWGARGFITDCNPAIHSEMRAPEAAPMTMPLDWFDIGTAAPVQCPDETWQARRLNEPDLMLVPGTLGLDPALIDGLAEAPPALRLPPSQLDALEAAGQRVGLSADRWHVCLSADGLDAADLATLDQRLRDIDGACVVALDAAAAGLPCAIDLSRLPRTAWPLRVLAIARARFVLATAGVDLALASAFRVPAAALLRSSGEMNLWNRGDLLPMVERPDGETLAAITDDLMARTADCTAWRPPTAELEVEAAQGLALPLPLRTESLLREWP